MTTVLEVLTVTKPPVISTNSARVCISDREPSGSFFMTISESHSGLVSFYANIV